MKLRILAGADLIRRTPAASGLSVLHQSAALRIEADAGAEVVRSPGGKLVICFGRATAPRGFGDLADAAPLASWPEPPDGRCILAVIAPDGSCSIGADRFGRRDLFVQRSPTGVALVSGLDLLPDSPGAGGYDQAALAHTLTYYGHRPPKRHTIYRGVERLGVGEVLTLRDGALASETAPFRPAPAGDYGAADHDRYADIFLDALSGAGSADGNLVYLSSGWDSTAILAGLVHVFGSGKVRALIGRMLYSERSGNCNRFEIERAQKIADYFGVQLDIVDFDHAKRGAEWAEKARPLYREQQFHSFTGLNHLILAEAAARLAPGAPVFAGEISDGAHNLGFSQYATIFHPSYEFREYADKMASYQFGPTFLRQLLAGRHEDDAVHQFFRTRAGNTRFDPLAADAAGRTRQLFVSFFLRNGRQPLWSLANAKVLTAAGADLYTRTMTDAYLADTARATPETLYGWYLHLYNSFHWQGSTVATLPAFAERSGLVANLPFWDSRLQAFLAAMPESWGRGLDLNSTKYPLKRMLQHRIDYPMALQTGPHSYTYDVDPSFNHSFEVMYHSTIGDNARSVLQPRPYRDILSPEMFDLDYLDGLVKSYLAAEPLSGAALSDLVSLYLLCQTGWYA